MGNPENQDVSLYEIQLRNISARALVSLIADFAPLNFVAGDELNNRRVDVVGNSIDLNQLLTKITKDQGLSTTSRNEILRIASDCRLSQFPNVPNQGSYRELIFTHFQSATGETFIDIFTKTIGKAVHAPYVNAQTAISTRVKDKTVGDHIAAIAAVQGWSVQVSSNGALTFVPNEQLKQCGTLAIAPVDKTVSSRSSPKDRVCLSQTKSKCMPLEYYELEELTPLGYVKRLSNSSQFAIFETNDELVYTAKTGDYLGANFGKILEITPEAVRLIELVPDNLGGWMEREVVLKVGVRYENPRTLLRGALAVPVVANRLQNSLVLAAHEGDRVKLEKLVTMGANLDATYSVGKENPLYVAALMDRHDAVAWLLRKGAKPNIFVTEFEETPLHVAARQGHGGIVEQLVAAGADVNIRDINERTAIEHAASANHRSIVASLIANKASFTEHNKWGITPYTAAAHAGHSNIVEVFLRNGLSINSQDRNGHTLLMAATAGGKADLVARLVELGAEVNLTNKYGETALDIALERKREAISDLLVSRGARTKNELDAKVTEQPDEQ